MAREKSPSKSRQKEKKQKRRRRRKQKKASRKSAVPNLDSESSNELARKLLEKIIGGPLLVDGEEPASDQALIMDFTSFGSRRLEMPHLLKHRKLREQMIADEDAISCSPNEYIRVVESELHKFGPWYEWFGETRQPYRRQSDEFFLKVSDSLRIDANAQRESVFDPITISVGTLLAIEDACQIVFSSPKEILEEWLCVETDHVHQSIGGLSFGGVRPFATSDHTPGIQDKFRFFDYRSVVEKESCTNFDFLRLVSMSRARRQIADYVSNMALYWIIAHEDAHSYLGHHQELTSLNASGVDPQIVHDLISLGDTADLNLRRAAEFDADVNASTRVVDFFVDRAIMRSLPDCLQIPNVTLTKAYENEESSQVLVVLRLVVLAISIALIVLHKSSYKYNAVMAGYPSLRNRIVSCIIAVFDRFRVVTRHFEGRGLVSIPDDELSYQTIFAEAEIARVVSDIYLNGPILADPDMNGVGTEVFEPLGAFTKQLKRSSSMTDVDLPFLNWIYNRYATHGEHDPISVPATWLQSEKDFLAEMQNSYSAKEHVFFPRRQLDRSNQQKKAKVEADLQEHMLRKSYLESWTKRAGFVPDGAVTS